MKISVNLATLSSPGERYALAWSLPLALLGALGFVLLSRAVVFNLNEYHKIQSRLDVSIQQEKEMRSREEALRKDLDLPGQRAEFQRAHFVNGLIEQKQFSVTELTGRISELLPASVRLVTLGVSRPKADIALRFSVVGHDEEGLEKFIENIEDAPDFTDLNVSNQSQKAGSPSEGMAGIVCTVRYLGKEAKGTE